MKDIHRLLEQDPVPGLRVKLRQQYIDVNYGEDHVRYYLEGAQTRRTDFRLRCAMLLIVKALEDARIAWLVRVPNPRANRIELKAVSLSGTVISTASFKDHDGNEGTALKSLVKQVLEAR